MTTKWCKKITFSVVINVVKLVALVLSAVVKNKAKVARVPLLVLPFPIYTQALSDGRTTVGHRAHLISTSPSLR